MKTMGTAAGEGEHKYYYLPGPKSEPLTSQSHYLGVDAVSWFVNKESGWFKQYSTSGTLEISLAGGQEKYEVPLGVYELAGGARVAPVFDRPVLPDRVYRGGPISFRATVSGLKKDTQLTKLIKSATSAGLGVVGGMVATATATGPYAPLAAAGSALIGGVKDVLSGTEAKLRLFDTSGFEVTLPQKAVTGRESYLFLHRGQPLDKKKLQIAPGDTAEVRYESELLDDGVWLLLRLRITTEYPLERPWHQRLRSWTAELVGLVDDVKRGRITKEEGSKRLSAGSEDKPTEDDAYRALRTEILADGVLTTDEATAYSLALAAYRSLASAAVAKGKYDEFFKGIGSLKSGASIRLSLAKLADTERLAAASARSEFLDLKPIPAAALAYGIGSFKSGTGTRKSRQKELITPRPLQLADYVRLRDQLSIEPPAHD
jgi:hypothetical protein